MVAEPAGRAVGRRWRRIGAPGADRWSVGPAVGTVAFPHPHGSPSWSARARCRRPTAGRVRGRRRATETPNGDAWVEPLDGGECPASHPIKVNESSGIYHVPGGRFYDRTVAVRCYATPEAATADGFRAAKA